MVKYNNYQIIIEKLHGPGWAAIGDAAGFIDPVLSTGLYLGMKDAFKLARAIEVGTPWRCSITRIPASWKFVLAGCDRDLVRRSTE